MHAKIDNEIGSVISYHDRLRVKNYMKSTESIYDNDVSTDISEVNCVATRNITYLTERQVMYLR